MEQRDGWLPGCPLDSQGESMGTLPSTGELRSLTVPQWISGLLLPLISLSCWPTPHPAWLSFAREKQSTQCLLSALPQACCESSDTTSSKGQIPVCFRKRDFRSSKHGLSQEDRKLLPSVILLPFVQLFHYINICMKG